MTKYEAQVIGSIVQNADGGCIYCVGDLVSALNEKFPEFRWEVVQMEDGEIKVIVV